jgi:hypothetical protein
MLALALGLVSCEQPRIKCLAGHGGFAATYTLIPGSKQGTGDCDTLLGEVIGLEKYNPSSSEDPTKQDLSQATLAIQSTALGTLARAAAEEGFVDEDSLAFSLGAFETVDPDENDVCYVPTLSEAEQNIPDLSLDLPQTDMKFEWRNVRLLVTAAYPGTQMVAELRYTENGCSASYSVTGLWPAVACEGLDADGNGTGLPDATLCNPKADPAAGRATGSGINPDLSPNVICDENLLLCVLKSPPEALR